ncbi:hypothetical protein B0H19DRAFT_1246080 [Mycena capillaripes]|nr:hypothetical protein B0H19DRAFT_1246080 [Mycena capillaripes]
MAPSPQEEAELLIEEIRAINKGQIDKEGFTWPSFDYDQVSTETCQALLALIGKPTKIRAHTDITATPRHERIARHLDSVLATRQYFAKKRAFDAQNLNDCLSKDLEPIFNFLRAARRSAEEQFTFPDAEHTILHSLNAVRKALDRVEDMVIGSGDLEETAPDTEDGDPDATRVDFKLKSEFDYES